MKSCALAVFVKTPGHSPVKTRLAADIGAKAAEDIYRLSVAAIERTARIAACLMPQMTPLWAVAEKGAMGSDIWRGFGTVRQGKGALGQRLSRVYSHLRERFACVLIIGADSPQLEAKRLVKAAELLSAEVSAPFFVLGPALDGGFYLFGGSRPLPARVWTEVPYGASNTAAELKRRLQPFGNVCEFPQEADIDTAQDMPIVKSALLGNRLSLSPPQERLFAALTALSTSHSASGPKDRF